MIRAVIHIVASLDRINFGIWNAALLGTAYLYKKDVTSIMISMKEIDSSDAAIHETLGVQIKTLSAGRFFSYLHEIDCNPFESIIVTHGCWSLPTRLGALAKKKGFCWIYTPHGMLEPWSMSQKRFKKFVYFNLFEKRWADKADVLRAVSEREADGLQKKFNQEVVCVENGVIMPPSIAHKPGEVTFLFMARLHHKKGILPLVEAWHQIMRSSGATLIIAGPDEGELEKIQPFISGNIQYVGGVYGADKVSLLHQAHYYVLPSYSEGFPTSVVEAMSYGAIPLISKGCNFEAVFENNLGYQVEPDKSSIINVLEKLKATPWDETLSRRNYEYILNHNSEEVIGEQLYQLYSNLVAAKDSH